MYVYDVVESRPLWLASAWLSAIEPKFSTVSAYWNNMRSWKVEISYSTSGLPLVRYIIFSPFPSPSLSSFPDPQLPEAARVRECYSRKMFRSLLCSCSCVRRPESPDTHTVGTDIFVPGEAGPDDRGISCRLSQTGSILIEHSLDCRHLNEPPSGAHIGLIYCAWPILTSDWVSCMDELHGIRLYYTVTHIQCMHNSVKWNNVWVKLWG